MARHKWGRHPDLILVNDATGKSRSAISADRWAQPSWVQTTWMFPGLLVGTLSFRVEQGVRALSASPLARKLPFPEVVLERSRIFKRSCKHSSGRCLNAGSDFQWNGHQFNRCHSRYKRRQNGGTWL